MKHLLRSACLLAILRASFCISATAPDTQPQEMPSPDRRPEHVFQMTLAEFASLETSNVTEACIMTAKMQLALADEMTSAARVRNPEAVLPHRGELADLLARSFVSYPETAESDCETCYLECLVLTKLAMLDTRRMTDLVSAKYKTASAINKVVYSACLSVFKPDEKLSQEDKANRHFKAFVTAIRLLLKDWSSITKGNEKAGEPQAAASPRCRRGRA